MNGRVYDPSIGRFLSPDIQVPYIEHTQSFNRYSYVQNNPLSRVDPSGYGDKTASEREREEENAGCAANPNCALVKGNVGSSNNNNNDDNTVDASQQSSNDSGNAASGNPEQSGSKLSDNSEESEEETLDDETSNEGEDGKVASDGAGNANYHKKPLVRVTTTKITFDLEGLPHPETVDEQTTYGGIDGCCAFEGTEKTVEYSLDPRKPSDVLNISIDDVTVGIPVYRTITETYKYSPSNLCSSGGSCQSNREPNTEPTGDWRTFQKMINFIKSMQPND